MRLHTPRAVWSTAIAAQTAVFAFSSSPLDAQDQPLAPKTLALKVGTIHPVSGPDIENGVIIIRGGRIRRIGPADKIRISARATVLDYPNAHAYPGLVDAMSTAFASSRDVAYKSTNAGTDFFDALDLSDEESRKLVRYGITTAYVSNRSGATWRGLGAIIRPNKRGFSLLPGKRHGGLSLRMTTGASAGHALDRLKRFDSTGNAFDALESYEKQQKDYKKALDDYAKARAKYLAYYREKAKAKKPATKPGKKPADKSAEKPADKSAKKPPAMPEKSATDASGKPPANRRGRSGERTGGRRRGGFGRRGNRTGGFPSRRGTQPGSPRAGTQDASGKTKAGSSAPKKPKWPKRVKKDKAKDALLAVLEDKLPLRVEAHRKDEIRAALFMAFTKDLPGMTLEYATEAGDIAEELAEAGATVVVSSLLPGSASYDKDRDGTLPAELHKAGVPVAIGSGSAQNARNLTMMAAYACGRGLPEKIAIRAITLTAAEILGIADRVGSLDRQKVADVLITSGALLASDTKVLRVIAQGQTQYEAEK